MSELDRFIERRADLLGLRAYHVPDSRRVTDRGFPDWVLAGPAGVIFAETKQRYEPLLPDQAEWLQLLDRAGLTVRLWREQDGIFRLIEDQTRTISGRTPRYERTSSQAPAGTRATRTRRGQGPRERLPGRGDDYCRAAAARGRAARQAADLGKSRSRRLRVRTPEKGPGAAAAVLGPPGAIRRSVTAVNAQ